MAVNTIKKPVSINPLKISQPLGGSIALQGFYRSMPIVHGSQGCASFIKALMTRHYREPIAMQTSALQEMSVIFDAGKCLTEALDAVIAKHGPDLIGVLSTSLTEVAGDDLMGNVKQYIKDRQISGKLIVPVSLPDHVGSLESGYSKTVEAVIGGILQMSDKSSVRTKRLRVNLLPGSHMTPGDVRELKEILSEFGCDFITIPDLSTSLSGHVMAGFSPLSRGGVMLEDLHQMLSAELTIAIGESMAPAAKKLEEGAGIPYRVFPSLTGVRACDEFFSFMQNWSGNPVPVKYRWQRENLMDCMLDAHFFYAGKSAVIALEPDHLYAMAVWLQEMGIEIRGAVSSVNSPVLNRLNLDVWVGDFSDLEEMADDVDLWVSNSHGAQGAKRKKAAFLPLGFPVFDRLGSPLFTSIGYRGTTELVIQTGNMLIAREEEKEG